MDNDRVQKIIRNVNSNLSIEGMPLTSEDRDRIRLCLAGKSTVDEMVRKLVDKHMVRRA